VEPPAQAVDPVDDPLDLEIDARQLVLRQEPVDVVFVGQVLILIGRSSLKSLLTSRLSICNLLP